MNSEGWGASSEVWGVNSEALLDIQALFSGPSPGNPKVLSNAQPVLRTHGVLDRTDTFGGRGLGAVPRRQMAKKPLPPKAGVCTSTTKRFLSTILSKLFNISSGHRVYKTIDIRQKLEIA